MKKMEADIVIVGAGMSGLAASAQAAELGASVITLEKSSITGGQANMGSGPLALESLYQRDMLEDNFTVEMAFNEFMDYNHWRVDARLVRRIFDLSGDSIKWVDKMGVKFVGVFKYSANNSARRTWHVPRVPGINKPTERAGAILQKGLTDYAMEQGVHFEFNTSVKEVIMDGGRAIGVRAVNDSGEQIEVYADAVLVGTGGFVDNPAMQREVFGDVIKDDGKGFGVPGISGDGLRMCWKVGAGRTKIIKHGLCAVVGLTDLFKTLGEVMHQHNLIVDVDGKRFINEMVMSNSAYFYEIVNCAKNRQFYCIINDEILDFYKKNGLETIQLQHDIKTIENWDKELTMYIKGEKEETPLASMHEAETRPNGFYVFDTLEKLCETLNIPEANLRKTLERYNSMAHQKDLDFYKEPKFMKPVNGGKYYVARYVPFGAEGIGGVKTNSNLQCLNDEGEIIPGLYSMGTEANNLYSECYNHNFPGSFMGFAMNSGRIAAKEAIGYLNSLDE